MVLVETKNLLVNLLAATNATTKYQPFAFDPGFAIEKVVEFAITSPSHSWEYGVAAEALLELYHPQYSVFGSSAFPVPTLDPNEINSLAYALQKIEIGEGHNGLSHGSGSVADPASLGVAAVMLGKTNPVYADAAYRQMIYMTQIAPRWGNGAISHRANVAELWADYTYMSPPFLAYYAADTNDEQLLLESVQQLRAYREVLQRPGAGELQGAWSHIIGPESQDTGLWSTGNAWAAAGMARVLATVMKAPVALNAGWRQGITDELTTYIKEIIDAARRAPMQNGLLRNYLDNTDVWNLGFGEISGSTLLAATAYRMAVMRREVFGSEYVDWADGIRGAIGGTDEEGRPHVIQETGVVTPAVNPNNWMDRTPQTTGSPEGQSFVVLMHVAWSECVRENVCPLWRRKNGAPDTTKMNSTAKRENAAPRAAALAPPHKRHVNRLH